ncbi:MAG: hypothetical protein ACM30G_02355 [Micromonosporaceae bacterium]
MAEGRRRWLVVVPAERYAEERLYAHETVALPPAGPLATARPGDDVALVAEGALIALGRVVDGDNGCLLVRYSHRFFDDPVPAPATDLGGSGELSEPAYRRLIATAGRGHPELARWQVSIALPIEAGSAGEAVREFWSYVSQLGPRELPAFVWPAADELAMQAFVLGALTSLDPEEDEPDPA